MAFDTQLGRMLQRPDPLLAFRWVAKSVPFSELGPIDDSFIESFEIPFNNIKADGVFFGGGYNYFPQFHDVSAFNVNFYADSKGRSLKYLLGWKSMVKDFETGLYNLPTEYKRPWVVALLDAKGNGICEVTYEGCWPADTGQLSLDYSDGSTRLVLNQNFSTDSMSVRIL